jgi:transcriptional regulator with XRE-family HTH domain
MSDIRTPVWTLGERLRKCREDAHLTQSAMAIRLGYSRQAIASWESDRTAPRLVVLREWASVCNDIPLWWLLDDGALPEGVTARQLFPLPIAA